MSGINGTEFVIIALIVLIVVGPEKLPELAAQLGRVVREVKSIASGAKARVEEEFGPDIEELKALDPRQYDPRRIVRDALKDEPTTPPRRTKPAPRVVTSAAATGVGATAATSTPPPPASDSEATPTPPAPETQIPQVSEQDVMEAESELASATPFDDEAT